MNITKKSFGVTKNQESCSIFTMQNKTGASIEFTDYGCRVISIYVPDSNGNFIDVCLGYNTLAEYESDPFYFGACVGRHANRIGNACFTLNNKTYQLEKNNYENHLHGGNVAFHNQVWDSTITDNKVIFSRTFLDGESGYPGNLDVFTTYEWTDDNEFHISYEASCDQDTVFNITNHTYFNLEGCMEHSVLDQELQISASKYTEIDHHCLTTGVISDVSDSPFDFRTFKKVGHDINSSHIQMKNGGGYDHNFVLDGKSYRKVAVLKSPLSKIQMSCFTDQPGIQIYTSNFTQPLKEKHGITHIARASVCLETQHFPNATSIKEFPSVVLKANSKFTSKTSYVFDLVD